MSSTDLYMESTLIPLDIMLSQTLFRTLDKMMTSRQLMVCTTSFSNYTARIKSTLMPIATHDTLSNHAVDGLSSHPTTKRHVAHMTMTSLYDSKTLHNNMSSQTLSQVSLETLSSQKTLTTYNMSCHSYEKKFIPVRPIIVLKQISHGMLYKHTLQYLYYLFVLRL